MVHHRKWNIRVPLKEVLFKGWMFNKLFNVPRASNGKGNNRMLHFRQTQHPMQNPLRIPSRHLALPPSPSHEFLSRTLLTSRASNKICAVPTALGFQLWINFSSQRVYAPLKNAYRVAGSSHGPRES